MPLLLDVAVASVTLPMVGPTTVSDIHAHPHGLVLLELLDRSRGFVSAAVIVTGAGRALPAETSVVTGPEISVMGGLLRSAEGMNSTTVPVTWTALPTTATLPGAPEVNTKTPSDVFGSPSFSPLSSGVWMKNPLLRTPVTMLTGVVTTSPTKGETPPEPWIWLIATGSAGGGGAISQSTAAVALLRGTGEPRRKSASLSLVSRQPWLLRSSERVVEGEGAGPEPSKQSADEP